MERDHGVLETPLALNARESQDILPPWTPEQRDARASHPHSSGGPHGLSVGMKHTGGRV